MGNTLISLPFVFFIVLQIFFGGRLVAWENPKSMMPMASRERIDRGKKAALPVRFLGYNNKGAAEFEWLVDGAEMVMIPTGKVTISPTMPDGTGSGPKQVVDVSSFLVDKTEVTNQRFLCYLNSSKSKIRDSYLYFGKDGFNNPLQPAPVTYLWALRYAKWAKKQIPTEAEWVRCARGNTQITYPWGDGSPTMDNFRDSNVWAPHQVAKQETDVSVFGLFDMGNNVFEWCVGMISPWDRLVKGGTWEAIDPLVEGRFVPICEDGYGTIGFRCVVRLTLKQALELEDLTKSLPKKKPGKMP